MLKISCSALLFFLLSLLSYTDDDDDVIYRTCTQQISMLFTVCPPDESLPAE